MDGAELTEWQRVFGKLIAHLTAMTRRVPIRPRESVERLRKRFEPTLVEPMMEGIRACATER